VRWQALTKILAMKTEPNTTEQIVHQFKIVRVDDCFRPPETDLTEPILVKKRRQNSVERRQLHLSHHGITSTAFSGHKTA
jgi:hypothetical protein